MIDGGSSNLLAIAVDHERMPTYLLVPQSLLGWN